MDARSRVSELARSGIVLAACAVDIAINFPLWVIAKRITAGLTRPAPRELYKGAGSLLFACAPMVAVQDQSTGAILSALGGGGVAHATAACVSGAVGALVVGSQVESVITRAHSQQETVVQTIRRAYAAGGALALVAPLGSFMVAAREVPYAGTLFFLSGWIRERLGANSGARSVFTDMVSALCSAAVAGPLSHVPSVISAHQQARCVTITTAVREIAATGGAASFFRGIVPRTLTLSGTLFVIPLSIDTLQPWAMMVESQLL